VAVGSCVKFIGKIRSNHENKVDHYRPVYEVAQEEDTC
jgi:hypothetical protein